MAKKSIDADPSIFASDYSRRVNTTEGAGPHTDYTKGNHSFSGADTRILFAIPTGAVTPVARVMENIQTITYSVFRESTPARALGWVGEKGRARGIRTIAGSIIFTVFEKHPLWGIMQARPGDRADNIVEPPQYAGLEYTMPDQLPPFEIVLHFANEYGFAAELVLFGVQLQSSGQVMSIQDVITEETYQFTAAHVAIMRSGGWEEALSDTVSDQYGHLSLRPRRSFESIMNSSNSEESRSLIRKSHNPFR